MESNERERLRMHGLNEAFQVSTSLLHLLFVVLFGNLVPEKLDLVADLMKSVLLSSS